MPIKPENKARYPKDWPAIRERIMRRARNRCEECGVQHHDIGYRDDSGEFRVIVKAHEREGGAADYAGHATGWKVIMVVLTIAHLDHQPENCADENLRAWCQRCHLRYDHEHHQRNARETRRNRKACGDLFAEVA